LDEKRAQFVTKRINLFTDQFETIHSMCKGCMYGCSLLVGGRGDYLSVWSEEVERNRRSMP